MNVIGEAFVRIKSLGDSFSSDVKSHTDPAFHNLEKEAGVSGEAAAGNIRGGLNSGLTQMESDVGASGKRSGEDLHTGMKSGLDNMETDVKSSGLKSGDDLRGGMKSGLDNMESDLQTSGSRGGAKLRSGMGTELKGLEGDATKSGDRAGSGLASAMSAKLGKSAESGPLGGLTKMLEGVPIPAAVAGGALLAVGGVIIDAGLKMQEATSKIAASAGISQQAAAGIGQAFNSTAGTVTFTGQEMAVAFATVAGQLTTLNGKALDAKQSLDFMKASMDLAESSGVGLSNAVGDMAKVLQNFQLGVKDAGSVADELFNIANKTGQSVDTVSVSLTKLNSGLGSSSPGLVGLGGLVEDLATHGESGRKSITALTAGLSAMNAPTAKTEAAAKSLGVTLVDSTGKFVGMGSVIQQLQPAFAGHTADQQKAMLAAIGFGKSAQLWQEAVAAGPKVLALDTLAMDKHGSAADAAGARTNTFGDAWKKARAGITDAASMLGAKLAPALTTVAAKVAEAIHWVVDNWPEISKTIKTAFDVVKPYIEGFITQVKGIVKVIEGVVQLVEDIFHGKWGQAWDAMKKIVDGAVEFVKGKVAIFIAPFRLIVPELEKVWGDFRSAVTRVINDVTGYFAALPARILGVLSSIVATIFAPFLLAASWIDTNVLQPIVGFFTGLPGRMLSALGNIVGTVFGPLLTAGTWVLTNVIAPVVSTIAGLPGQAVGALGDIVGKIFGGLTAAASWVTSNVVGPVAGAFSAMPGAIGSAIVAAFKGAVNIGSEIITWIKNGINAAIDFYDSHRPSVLGVSLLPFIPHLATGGLVTQPTIALIGEAGPEYVIPAAKLWTGNGVSPTMSTAHAGGGSSVSVNVQPGAVVIHVGDAATGSNVEEAVNEGFVTLTRELAASVAPMRGGGT